MKRALIKACQYLLLGIILLLIVKFGGDTDITPYAILIAILTVIVFFAYLFVEKRKSSKSA